MTTIEILKWVKANKKDFLNQCAKNWQLSSIHINCATTGWQMLIKKTYCMPKPRYGDELLIIGRVIQFTCKLHELKPDELLSVLRRLHIRYSERIEKKFFIKAEKGTIAQYKFTDYMHELILRGFKFNGNIYESDGYIDTDYYSGSNLFKLYSKPFTDKEDAQEYNKNFGIPLITYIV